MIGALRQFNYVFIACLLVLSGVAASAADRGANTAVRRATVETRISFLNEVEPILTRAGCNAGACHGSQFGKGGLKLSLAAYDPQMDYDSIVRQGRGRHISTVSPESSQLLRKPAMELPHGGGLKIEHGSEDYRTLVRWLRQGATGPDPRDPHIIALDITPARRILRPKEQVRLSVRARYSDGTLREVTAHTRIASLNDSVATTTPEGQVAACGPGETAIMLRYDGLASVSRIVVPYPRKDRSRTNARIASQVDSARFSSFVDVSLEKRWRELGLVPSPTCTDFEFIRRASLDIIGTLPSPEEVQAFASDRVPGKDAQLIDRLLSRPEYADAWAVKWGDLLRGSRATLGEKGMWSFRNWIRESLLRNRPYNEFVFDLITAQGGAYSQPSANYYRVVTGPQELSESAAQVFLGIRLQCAKCHHHPFEKWSQTDYYQFAAFFARVGAKESREPGAAAPEPTVRLLDVGEVTHPKTGARMIPTPLALRDIPQKIVVNPDASGDRRRALADWLTSADNGQFARMLVNRYWGFFLGRGIVHPVDDMRVTNPAANPELLEGLARNFTAHGTDLKHLIRVICTSRAYRLSSAATPWNRGDSVFCTHFSQRRQPAEVLLDSLDIATGAVEKFPGLPVGTRAIQLPDAAVASPFLDTFGRPARTTSCECERASEPSLSQALQMLNGDLVNRKVGVPNGRVARLIESGKSSAEIVTSLYHAALSRPPRASELSTALRALAVAPSRRQGAEDLLWALLNTKEFAAVR